MSIVRTIMTLRIPVLAALLALAAFGARAQITLEGHTFDDRADVGGQELVLNGAGLRAVAWLKGYAAALYLPARTGAADQAVATPGPKRLQIRMLLDVPAEEFIKSIDKGIERNSADQAEALAGRRDEFDRRVRALGSVKKGDIVNLDYLPGQGLLFSVNGRPQGAPIDGEPFYAAVLRIFLGAQPVDSRLKSSLLGAPYR